MHVSEPPLRQDLGSWFLPSLLNTCKTRKTSSGNTLTTFDRAPGGYSAAILKLHTTAKIFGVTLHKEEGGVSFAKSSYWLF
jgi:hypothetical protein